MRQELARTAEIERKLGRDEALHHLTRMREIYGDHPEISLRQSLFYLNRGNPEAAVETVLPPPANEPLLRVNVTIEVLENVCPNWSCT